MTKQSIDIHADVTAKIIAAIESGTFAKAARWLSVAPRRDNGERYRGINLVLLCIAMEEKGYTSPRFLTFKQARELGGAVRKGERGARIVYYNIHEKEIENDKGDMEARRYGFIKQYYVFNVAQIDGLPADYYTLPEAATGRAVDLQAAQALYASGATIRHGGNRAYYDIEGDSIVMPAREQFTGSGAYLATLAHELIHWTGAAKRLDRGIKNSFGTPAYAFEELVAEIGAAMLCERLGIDGLHIENHAHYVQSWLKVLENDKRAIFRAASLAQAAVDHVTECSEAALPQQVAA